MKRRTLTFLKNNACLIAPPLITLTVLLVGFYLHGVVPFGKLSVAYFDMGQLGVTRTMHIWDALHSSKMPIHFNWYTGLGMPDNTLGFSFFWIVLLFIKRSYVYASMSLYVILSFMASSVTAAFFFKKITKANQFFIIFLSLCYAFCGYSVMYYTNMWQDTVILFPLLLLAWYKMFNSGKVYPFVIMLSLSLICSFYITTLMLFYLFFISFAYIMFMTEKSERGRNAFKLGFGVFSSLGISSAVIFPKYYQSYFSERYLLGGGNADSSVISKYFETINNNLGFNVDSFSFVSYKLFMFICLAFPLIIILFGIKQDKKNKNKKRFFLFAVFYLVFLCVCEGSNTLLHLGSYVGFPIRMGYALIFVILWGAAEYSSCIDFNIKKLEKKNIIISYTVCARLFFALFFGVGYLVKNASVQYAYVLVLPVVFIIYMFILILTGFKFDYRSSMLILIAEALIVTTVLIPFNDARNYKEDHSLAFITESQQLKDDFKIEESTQKRIKTIGGTLNSNYGILMKRATIADYTGIIPPGAPSALRAAGYSLISTRICGTGGTAFSDAVLGVTNLLSVKDESEALYNRIDTNGYYNYYDCKYTMPFSLMTDGDYVNYETIDKSWKDNQNELYKSITGKNDDIVYDSGYKLVSKPGKTEVYTFKSKPNTSAYFELEGAKKVEIFVNGKKQTIPSTGKDKNEYYPTGFNNRLINLGEFGDSTVEIKLVFNEGKFQDDKNFDKTESGEYYFEYRDYYSNVSLLDLNKLREVCKKSNDEMKGIKVDTENYSLSISNVNGKKGKALLIPLMYRDGIGWSAEVNGKPAKLYSANGFLCAVKLDEGKNDIKLKYTPPGLYIGIAVSAVSLIIYLLYELLKARFKRLGELIAKLTYIGYSVAFLVGIITVFIIPFIYMFIK